jgi:hypothetical protein
MEELIMLSSLEIFHIENIGYEINYAFREVTHMVTEK